MKFYIDIWQVISKYLPIDDLYSLSLTCKNAYKACKRHDIRARLSYPLKLPYRLTYDQRELIKNMLNRSDLGFKLIKGDVGSGKTISVITYAIRKYVDANPETKVLMVAPPSLMKMWWNTLEKFFGYSPCVLHSTSKNYVAGKSWAEVPDETFILTSSNLFASKGRNLDWFDKTRDLLIIDESHHNHGVYTARFKEIIGLSATSTNHSGNYNWLIDTLAYRMNTTTYEASFILEKKVLGKKLPEILYHEYIGPITETVSKFCLQEERSRIGLKCIPSIASALSHPFLADFAYNLLCSKGMLKIGRKKFKVEFSKIRAKYLRLDRRVWVNSSSADQKELANSRATSNKTPELDITVKGDEYFKYKATLSIVEWAKERGEKVILFDISVVNLPFLHKYLLSKGVKSYIFSTHYGVAARQNQLEKFKKDGDILLSSTNMLGEGHNITEANHVIFFSHCTNKNRYHQGIGRCHRYPQEKPVHVFLLFTSHFDKNIYDYAYNKAESVYISEWKEHLILDIDTISTLSTH